MKSPQGAFKASANDPRWKNVEKIKVKLFSSPLKLLEHDRLAVAEIVAREICEDVKKTLEGHKPYFLTSLKVEGGNVKGDSAYTLASARPFLYNLFYLIDFCDFKAGK